MRSIKLHTTALALIAMTATGAAAADVYGPFPVTLKGYEGEKTNSVSYSGQIARHALHDSLKKAAALGNGGANAAEVEALMLSYFNGSDADLDILAPKSKDGFPIKQTTVNAISKGKNISGKFYKGAMPAWPGNGTGKDAVMHMIKMAAKADKGFDAENGYDWGQVISKFTMGAMMYNQSVDNYLDEKLAADNKPNDKPYKDGAYYTGKEHSWDEGFGYWGAPAHAMSLTPQQAYAIAKGKDLAAADANGDGMVDLKTEYVFGPAYYAAGADKGGTKSTNYMHTIMQAFIDGRQVIADAKGEALSDEARAQLKAHAATIESNWEKVLAEAAFKYAGSVYKDINKMAEAEGEEKAKAYRAYVKHWGELKGFAMALQSGRNNLGATAVELNNLVGFGPVTMDNSYVTGIDADGNFVRDRRMTWNDYQLNMLKTQELLKGKFGLKSLANDQLAQLEGLADKMKAEASAETD
ncbi:DUF4856 domain-containing protein [Thalassobius sp. Cn5-15]|uniref:DUF4856 domain-containing protein n=1 Tax=Thalassobius sp. Cn5-15 TaxID=2917763 RepID=UPI001EF22763|nr:DUF4856 domain-containing protein [Thalassobius sp. Cn5-15]MCG7493263.1 DUF4856 domain-containing protein [Thalassobius sp. Cn5-15]